MRKVLCVMIGLSVTAAAAAQELLKDPIEILKKADAATKADPVLLEPVMEVEAVTPEEYMGDVIGDLNRRRGRVINLEPRAGFQVVSVYVPLAEMFGYATDLRSATQGRATYTMQFDHYDEVPRNLADEIVARAKGLTTA